MMWDRDQLETFARVVDEGSFERAAASLNVTRGAVSQRIKALEESVAAVLLVRDRPAVPTSKGEILLRHVKALRLLEEAAVAELMPSTTARTPAPLAIAVNADSLATWVPGALWSLLRKQRIALEVLADDQDHTLSRLARGEVIGCVSTESRASSGFIAKPLGAMEYHCCASQDFAKQYFPDGLSLHAALAAPAVLFNRKDSLHDDFLATVFGFRVERYIKHYLPAPVTLLDGVRAGIGYGLLPTLQVQSLDNPSQLVDLAPDQPVLVNLYWHHWEVEPPLAQEITQTVVEVAARLLGKGALV